MAEIVQTGKKNVVDVIERISVAALLEMITVYRVHQIVNLTAVGVLNGAISGIPNDDLVK